MLWSQGPSNMFTLGIETFLDEFNASVVRNIWAVVIGVDTVPGSVCAEVTANLGSWNSWWKIIIQHWFKGDIGKRTPFSVLGPRETTNLWKLWRGQQLRGFIVYLWNRLSRSHFSHCNPSESIITHSRRIRHHVIPDWFGRSVHSS